jgi:hypothetical protein
MYRFQCWQIQFKHKYNEKDIDANSEEEAIKQYIDYCKSSQVIKVIGEVFALKHNDVVKFMVDKSGNFTKAE